MKTGPHLFYRRTERQSDTDVFVDEGFGGLMNVGDDPKISDTFHSIFNSEAGDSYAWPCDNMTKEEMDKLWDDGNRAFVLQMGYKEVVIYDIKIFTHEEYMSFNKKKKEKRDKMLDDLLEYCDIEDGKFGFLDMGKWTRNNFDKVLRENGI